MVRFIGLTAVLAVLLMSCGSKRKLAKNNGYRLDQPQINAPVSQGEEEIKPLVLQPGDVIETYFNEHRIVPIYKLDYNDNISGTHWHVRWGEPGVAPEDTMNDWHNHFVPGLSAVYGYSMLNIGHVNLKSQKKHNFFDSNVLVKTVYYPSFYQDTLQGELLTRNYYLVSVYDEDTNNDSIVNHHDLRRFYHFDITATEKTLLIPKDYSVLSSDYDFRNDVMYVKARKDVNENGSRENEESIHIFGIDLKDPKKVFRVY